MIRRRLPKVYVGNVSSSLLPLAINSIIPGPCFDRRHSRSRGLAAVRRRKYYRRPSATGDTLERGCEFQKSRRNIGVLLLNHRCDPDETYPLAQVQVSAASPECNHNEIVATVAAKLNDLGSFTAAGDFYHAASNFENAIQVRRRFMRMK